MTCGIAEEKDDKEKAPAVEVEFMASDIYRAGTFALKTVRELHLNMEYFGNPEFDGVLPGLSWKFQWKALSVSPGFAVAAGHNVKTSPVLTLTWRLETKHWFSQGFMGQSLTSHVIEPEPSEGEDAREGHGPAEPRSVHASILDNNHVSYRWKALEMGGLWEHIQYRAENEWKGGVRVAARFARHYKAILQVVGPRAETRGGLAFEY